MEDIKQKAKETFWEKLRKNVMWRDSSNGVIENQIDELISEIIDLVIAERDKEIVEKIVNTMDIGALASGTEKGMIHNAGWENCKETIINLITNY